MINQKNINLEKKQNNEEFELFINILTRNGKKDYAFNIFYKMLVYIKTKSRINSNFKLKKISVSLILKQAIKLTMPKLKLITCVRGNQKFQIPMILSILASKRLAVKWLILGARTRSNNKKFFQKLGDEIFDVLQNKGFALKKKQDLHNIALKMRSNLKSLRR